MHNPESILEKERHKLFWYFEIQTDHQTSVRQPDLEIVEEKKEPTELIWYRTLISQTTGEHSKHYANRSLSSVHAVKWFQVLQCNTNNLI